jgi:hypothetical protein
MKIIITEEQFSRFSRSSPALQNGINKYLNQYIENGNRKIGQKSRNYGNLREDWCISGQETITAIYHFDEDKFTSGSLLISKEIIETISNLYGVRPSYALHIIEEWYDDTMVPKFEQICGETGLYIDNIDAKSGTHECIPEPVKPEDIKDEEMIDFIVKNTLYRRPDVIEKIESGQRNLEDFYLDIVDTVNRKKITGY